MSNLSQFIASSGSATTTVFTSSGSFTAPKTGTYLFMLQGAGGGGGSSAIHVGSSSTRASASGGGAGKFLPIMV